MLAKLRSDVSKLKRSVELKHLDTSVGSNSIPLLAAEFPGLISLQSITQGTTDQSRTGRKITVRALDVSFNVTATTQGTVDTFIVLDKQCNGATAGATDIWEAQGPYTSANLLNVDNSGRFRVLSHKRTVFDQDVQYKTIQHRLKNVTIPIMYDSGTGAITDLTSNNILVFTQCLAASAVTINATAVSRVTYSDV